MALGGVDDRFAPRSIGVTGQSCADLPCGGDGGPRLCRATPDRVRSPSHDCADCAGGARCSPGRGRPGRFRWPAGCTGARVPVRRRARCGPRLHRQHIGLLALSLWPGMPLGRTGPLIVGRRPAQLAHQLGGQCHHRLGDRALAVQVPAVESCLTCCVVGVVIAHRALGSSGTRAVARTVWSADRLLTPRSHGTVHRPRVQPGMNSHKNSSGTPSIRPSLPSASTVAATSGTTRHATSPPTRNPAAAVCRRRCRQPAGRPVRGLAERSRVISSDRRFLGDSNAASVVSEMLETFVNPSACGGSWPMAGHISSSPESFGLDIAGQVGLVELCRTFTSVSAKVHTLLTFIRCFCLRSWRSIDVALFERGEALGDQHPERGLVDARLDRQQRLDDADCSSPSSSTRSR